MQDIALDLTSGKMYWGNLNEAKLQRANLDGTGIEDLATGVAPTGIVLDLPSGKVYWSDQDADTIARANLDGSNPEVLITGLLNPNGLAILRDAGKLYWVESSTVSRADLDGANPETLVTGLDAARDVDFDFRHGIIFSDGFESGGTSIWTRTIP